MFMRKSKLKGSPAASSELQVDSVTAGSFQQALAEWSSDQSVSPSTMTEMTEQLSSVQELADEMEQCELASAMQAMRDLLHCVENGESNNEEKQSMLQFVAEHASATLQSVESGHEDADTLVELALAARELCGDSAPSTGTDSANDSSNSAHVAEQSQSQIDLMLSVLGGQAMPEAADTNTTREPEAADVVANQAPVEMFANVASDKTTGVKPVPPKQWPACPELVNDAELREAFLDDANRCLAEMESVVLDADAYPNDAERAQNFCRQLHTLKGASASVGLDTLARYLHEVEEWLEHSSAAELDDDFLLAAVDAVRQQMDALDGNVTLVDAQQSKNDTPAPTNTESVNSNPASPNAAPAATNGDAFIAASSRISSPISATNNEATVRVRASQLDKLMDMLAELVAIRNQRESRFCDLSSVNNELSRCSNRLRRFSDERVGMGRFLENRSPYAPATTKSTTKLALGTEPSSANAIDEIANDLVALSRDLGTSFQPLADESVALSQFIRYFRQELMQLRRLPVNGLFQRLKRSIRDAAQAEGKQVDIQLVGEETGLEQTIQERLYEPLLHMVRNSVSHGIETPDARQSNKKPDRGIVTLHAAASASMLVIKVSDDGQGLNFDALRRRGLERGLLPAGSNPSEKQLAKLIFHPGFSTRDSASQVSGRGIGMDVVATKIDQMRGRIEVESVRGQGTTISISIPLTTGIEHVMQFRSGDQRFALPMSAIMSVIKNGSQLKGSRVVSLSESLNLPNVAATKDDERSVLMLDKTLGIQVDEVLGPDEVVVRALPELLRRHPLFNGVILSASGDTVMLLNADRAAQWLRQQDSANDATTNEPQTDNGTAGNRRVLVVDDSLSARKSLAKRLRSRGFVVVEAGDGLEALRCLRESRFHLVTTDLDMPRMGGLELLNEIKQGGFEQMTTIVVSSRAKEDVWNRASECGAAAYLGKPANDEKLDQLLQEIELATD